MITTVFLSNNIIQVAIGQRSKKQFKVEKRLSYEMAEGNLLNGMITNEAMLVEELAILWEKENLPTKDIELIVNGLAFTVKRLSLPVLDDKKTRAVLPMEFEELETEEVPVFDYIAFDEGVSERLKLAKKIQKQSARRAKKEEAEAKKALKQAKKKGRPVRKSETDKTPQKEENIPQLSRDIMAARATQPQIEKWLEIFDEIGVTISAITISNATVTKYLCARTEFRDGVNVIIGIDDNTINSYLMINGKLAFSNVKRFFVDRGTYEFGEEAARRIEDMNQFFRTLKRPDFITKVHIFGFTKADTAALNANLREAGMKYVVENMASEDDEYMAAVGGLIYSPDDIDFLSAYYDSKKEKGRLLKVIKDFMIPIIVLAVAILGHFAMTVTYHMIDKDVQQLRDYTSNPARTALYEESRDYYSIISQKETVLNETEGMKIMMNSYPVVDSDLIKTVERTVGSNGSVSVDSYDASTGLLDMSILADDAKLSSAIAADLMSCGLFSDVTYTGYDLANENGKYTVHIVCTLNSGLEQ